MIDGASRSGSTVEIAERVVREAAPAAASVTGQPFHRSTPSSVRLGGEPIMAVRSGRNEVRPR